MFCSVIMGDRFAAVAAVGLEEDAVARRTEDVISGPGFGDMATKVLPLEPPEECFRGLFRWVIAEARTADNETLVKTLDCVGRAVEEVLLSMTRGRFSLDDDGVYVLVSEPPPERSEPYYKGTACMMLRDDKRESVLINVYHTRAEAEAAAARCHWLRRDYAPLLVDFDAAVPHSLSNNLLAALEAGGVKGDLLIQGCARMAAVFLEGWASQCCEAPDDIDNDAFRRLEVVV